MLNGHFVLDAVAHTFDLSEENYAIPRYTRPVAEMIYGVLSQAPAGYKLEREAILRDWPTDDTAALLFHESDTDVAVFHPLPIFAFKDGMGSLEKALEAITRWPNRFIGAYAAIDPLWGKKKAFAELERQVELLNPIGLKLYPMSFAGDVISSWRMDDPEIAYPLFEKAAELGIKTIAVHKAIPLGPTPTLEAFNPVDVEGAADRYPELNFEILHGGAAFAEETAWMLASYPNMYVNMESLNIILVVHPRAFAKILLSLMHVGGNAMLDKICWGSGTMQYHPRPCLEAFAEFTFPEDLIDDYGLFGKLSQITEEQKGKILGGNFARINGWDIEALKRGIADDEFTRDPSQPEPAPYSTTSIADKVVPPNTEVRTDSEFAPVPV